MPVWSGRSVLGASSGIGAEMARRLAADGTRVALVARREAELRRLAQEIGGAEGPDGRDAQALIYPHDVSCFEETPALFQTICRDLGGLDLVIYAAGVMPRITPEEYDFEKDLVTVEVNLLGAFAWLNESAERFARAREGTIVGISSVAGERGRGGYPVYGATKAALNAYLESLRNRLGKLGVAVVTIKLGPVDTPMTQGLAMPLMIPAGVAADRILAAARSRKRVAYIPWAWRPIMFVIRAIPSYLFQRLKKLNS